MDLSKKTKISQAEFVRKISKNSIYTQKAIKNILDVMQDTLIDTLAESDGNKELIVKISNDLQIGVKYSPPAKKYNIKKEEYYYSKENIKPFATFLKNFKLGVNKNITESGEEE